MTGNRRRARIVLVAVALLATPAGAVFAGDVEMDIEGGGWGHGIGMSQYGAYGQALQGRTAEEIIAHYYTGSSTGSLAGQVGEEHYLVADPRPLWVSLLAGRSVFEFTAEGGPLTVCHAGAGGCNHTVRSGEVWTFTALGDGRCRFEADGEPATDPALCQATVKGMTPNGAHVVIDGLEENRDEFARGVIRIRTPDDGATFHVALEIGLEEYMYGLAEVPFSWHTEALQAQALAGRSYAAWRAIGRGSEADFSAERKTTCWCHVFATTADQSYAGWANEAAAQSDRWQGAVDDTAGTVITHPDASQAGVVAAFYSSSTGGRTENAHDIWGGSPVSYLQSRPDPWSQAPEVNNPFASWSFGFSEAELADTLGVDKVDGAAIVTRFDSGTPSRVDFFGRTAGAAVTVSRSGPKLFTLLGLRGRNIGRFDYGTIPSLGGDFDGDGRDDVAMAIPFNGAWWVGESSPGEFTMSSWLNHTANSGLRDHVAGDFNGDGRHDVAVLQEGSGKLLVGLAKGGRFSLQAWANHADAALWGPLVVGDFDGDGVDDIAEYENRGERWRVYRIDNGDLVREFWYDFAVTNPKWGGHEAGDFNGDGRDDILSLDAATGDLIVLFSDGAGFAPSRWQTLPNDGGWRDIGAADFTGDGRDDLAAYDPVTATWWVTAGTAGTTGAAPAAWYTFANPNQDFLAQIAADFTGDGRVDIASYNRVNGKLKVLTSKGTAFTKKVWGVVPARDRVTRLLSIDATGDGITDVAAWDNRLRRWWVARSESDTFTVGPWGTLLR